MNFVRYARWMAERGHHVVVFCVADTPIASAANGMKVVFVRRNKKYFDVVNAWRIKLLFRQHGVTAVWLRDARDLSAIGFAKRLSGNAFKVVYHQAMQLGVKKRDFVHTIRFNRLDAWIALLPYLAEQVKTHTRLDPAKIFTVPLAAKMEKEVTVPEKQSARATLGIPQDAFVMGVLGRIAPLKGHDFLIEQLPQLRARGQRIELLFVGEPTVAEGTAYRDHLLARVSALGLTDCVHFRPFMEDVTSFFGAIDLYAMVSEGETFGNVTIEAMLCGAPVLGTNASGTPEILGHGELGFLFAVNDSQAFVEQVKWIVNHPIEVRETAELAQKTARSTYNRKTVCAQLEDVLHQIGYAKQTP